ncbi:DUF3899 domain-containing protein [Levilactobacillus zymae]|uniref:DUF3899 domain-containing protein n=1 Tax=Levilactobacillus zymae TaxID=267363 RepID=A0A1Y6JZ03_9LACO|nr:DUF3899 domain-containing protein [Levilactobacillus zymae]KRL15147.1 hypothetical protein FD38_GL000960 [Levilactobacillus zymae DSM 19395]QFR61437.1 DUF3899 domain-containing protein [Levilactobacillus zymae]GEO71685.1 hypothetical protein LZY01_08530 [Levilactobacillus zymae]SMS13544.1 hypothetical protein LZ3411_0494 [Levilactobacillus zymae]
MQQNWQRWGTGVIGASVLIGLVAHVLGMQLMVIGNLLFMLGLALVVVGAVLVLARGHLFTGWRHRRKKGQDPLPGEKVDVHDVATVKNSPIRVSPGARFSFLAGFGLIIVGIILTLV